MPVHILKSRRFVDSDIAQTIYLIYFDSETRKYLDFGLVFSMKRNESESENIEESGKDLRKRGNGLESGFV